MRSMFLNMKEGISQAERWFDTLVPEYVSIDSREIPDFIKFITDLSERVYYYNLQNEVAGTWSDFFSEDPNILAVLISRFNLQGIVEEFEGRKQKIIEAETDEDVLKALVSLFRFISQIANDLHMIRQRFIGTRSYGEMTEITTNIDEIENEVTQLSLYYTEAAREFGLEPDIDFSHFRFSSRVDSDTRVFITGNTVKERIENAMDFFVKLFDEFNSKFSILVKTTLNYVNKAPLTEKTFSPQLALFIAFLDLYAHLRQQINGITRRHLDFYFKEVLGIPSESSSPDTVHLLFDPEAQVKSVKLLTSDVLTAEIPGNEEPLIYKLENELVVTNARVAELKTIAVSDYKQILAPEKQFRDVNEVQVYKADNPVFNPLAFQKKLTDINSWPVLGEDQHELAGNLRAMDDAEIGAILASPLFYQTEGERSFTLSIELRSAPGFSLKKYISNFSQITRKKEDTVIHELFSSAFIIDYTALSGWEPVNLYTVVVELEKNAKTTLKVHFVLTPANKPMAIFDADLHRLKCSSSFPMVRLILNNFAEHNPYSFLRETLIDRITINVKVKGFKDLKMQNNIGPLSPVIPFQPFGPQPSVGSFLDIKNTNVFNRYTKDFSFHMEWLDLPRDKKGFEDYYKGYGVNYTNDVFTVGISALQGSVYSPPLPLQQKFRLFHTKPNSDELLNETDIEGVDFKLIEFLNKACLTDETTVADTYFKEGAVRLELSSPSEAFGHKLFPQVFPKTVLNNAKRFRKKLPLPNQPYIPVIKSISVDYELEYSENFKNEADGSAGGVQVFHQHPFGYHKIFPDNEKKNYYFMPQFEDSGNLCIGLSNAEPGSVLSLLFQMEEKNFHHTFHQPEEIKWSYLESNSWVELKGRDVLLSDHTNNFINSGVVKLRLPDEIFTANTILGEGLFWLRASSKKLSSVQANVVAISANGATAVRISEIDHVKNISLRLEPGMIKGFARTTPGIQNVWQLFPSYGGKVRESNDRYYVRVSERLRHKQRPVQVRDIIQVILEKFPQILIVKCFSTEQESLMVLPGINLNIVLIPKERDDGSFISEQPKVSHAILFQVKSFIQQLISPFVQIEVGNAVYEKIKVICKVMFTESAGRDFGALSRRLTNDINQFIAPWLHGGSAEIKIGSRIYTTDLQMFIKTRPYVGYITGFSVVHFYNTKNVVDDELEAEITDSAVESQDYISGSTPAAVLVPSSAHIITVLNEPEFEEPQPSGIQSFYIGEEFLISDKQERAAEEQQAAPPEPEPEEELFSLIITHNI